MFVMQPGVYEDTAATQRGAAGAAVQCGAGRRSWAGVPI